MFKAIQVILDTLFGNFLFQTPTPFATFYFRNAVIKANFTTVKLIRKKRLYFALKDYFLLAIS